MKRIKSFEEYLAEITEDKSKTDSYAPPKHVIQPAKGDKGFKLLKGLLSKAKKIIEPDILSTK
jgi:hypothetical protein